MEKMDQRVMITLIGEQPVPTLLPVLCENPTQVIMVHTERTEQVSKRLEPLLKGKVKHLLINNPYNIIEVQKKLGNFILENKINPTQVIFNLTGGTKPMAFAAYRLAEQFQSPFLYLQSEGKKSLLYRYRFSEQGAEFVNQEEIPPLITLDIYLKAHLGDYNEGPPRTQFEEMVYEILSSKLDETKTSVTHGGSLEIDLVFRCGNNVGIAEVKSGKSALGKEGINQLNTAAEQRFLGTYTTKFLILDRIYGSNNLELAEAHRIKVIELPTFTSDTLSEEDRQKLINIVTKEMGG